jgi:uncharacterized protein YecE (DUF72 family)
LAWWADQVADQAGAGDVFVYFNNDGAACAVRDAEALRARLLDRRLAVATPG